MSKSVLVYLIFPQAVAYKPNIGFVLKVPGPAFTKGVRLSQVLGLNVVLKLRLLSQLSFVLNPCS